MKLRAAFVPLCVGALCVSLPTWAQTPVVVPPAAAPSSAPAPPAAPAASVASPTWVPPAAPAAPESSAPVPAASPAEQPESLPPIPPEPASPAAAGDAVASDEVSTPGWFRFDSDFTGLSLWVGATHDLGGVGLATDIVVSSGAFSDISSGRAVPFSLAEFDVGPAFAFVDGALALTPMVGIQFDWVERRAVSLPAPQLYTIVNAGPVYFESWIQCYFYGLFTDGAKPRDNLYTRDFLLYKVAPAFALGPNVELTYLFDTKTVASLPVGGAAMLNYGKHSTLLVALGYETRELARASSGGSGDRAIAGRFTFIQTW